jgi:hypothetical protein
MTPEPGAVSTIYRPVLTEAPCRACQRVICSLLRQARSDSDVESGADDCFYSMCDARSHVVSELHDWRINQM